MSLLKTFPVTEPVTFHFSLKITATVKVRYVPGIRRVTEGNPAAGGRMEQITAKTSSDPQSLHLPLEP